MKGKTTLKDRFKEFCGEAWVYVILALFLLFLSVSDIIAKSVFFYDSSAIVTVISHEGVIVEYRDRKGTLRSDFMETSNEYSIGDEIIVHVDEWKYRSQKRMFLSDED